MNRFETPCGLHHVPCRKCYTFSQARDRYRPQKMRISVDQQYTNVVTVVCFNSPLIHHCTLDQYRCVGKRVQLSSLCYVVWKRASGNFLLHDPLTDWKFTPRQFIFWNGRAISTNFFPTVNSLVEATAERIRGDLPSSRGWRD